MDEKVLKDVFDYDFKIVRTKANPRPQEKGFYTQDWEGFFLHLESVHEHGHPSSYEYLVNISTLYNVPVPINKKRK